jgi:hypothetical protein
MTAFSGKQATMATAAILATFFTSADAFSLQQSAFAAAPTKTRQSTTRNARAASISRRIHLSSSNDNNSGDPIDKREGMADAFAAFNSLSSLDSIEDEADNEELKAELLADMMGDLSDVEVSTEEVVASFQQSKMDQEEATAPTDVDGIGSITSNESILTTEDVTNDILSQDIPLKESINVESFMSNAFGAAMADLGKGEVGGDAGYAAEVAKSVMQDEDFKREIGEIFDQAAEEMKRDIENMRKEQVSEVLTCFYVYIVDVLSIVGFLSLLELVLTHASSSVMNTTLYRQEQITEEARQRGIAFDESQSKRLAEAEASVSRLINKVAKETDAVQQAVDELERVKRESANPVEESALDLKRGGIVKQVAFVGMALFGSRALTEALLVASSPYGTEHFTAAAIQGVIALVCAACFFLVK